MTILPPRVRLRRGAWWGSRQARATAAACLATIVIVLAVPGPAAAYRCTDPPPIAPASGLTTEDCRVPAHEAKPSHVKKRGSVSTLTVFVLAIAAVLLIPIGRGMPEGIDPFGHDRFR